MEMLNKELEIIFLYYVKIMPEDIFLALSTHTST